MTAPYGEYFGQVAIQDRLGVSGNTLRDWIKRRQFPVYRRYSKGKRRHVWYTNDALIHAWEQAQVQLDRAHVEAHRKAGSHRSGLAMLIGKYARRHGEEGMAHSSPDAPPTPSSPPRNVR